MFKRFANRHAKNGLLSLGEQEYSGVAAPLTPELLMKLIEAYDSTSIVAAKYAQMVTSIGWPCPPLEQVQPFSVRLESPETLLDRLNQQVASQDVSQHSTHDFFSAGTRTEMLWGAILSIYSEVSCLTAQILSA